MPNAAEHQSAQFTKMLLLGPSGSGKTGALLSLILAGYRVSVIDMDNGLDWLVNKLKKDHPDKLGLLDFQTFKDKFKMTAAGPQYNGIPNAYTRAVQSLEKWDDGTVPSEWGPDRILVLDSLTFFGDAAYNWKDALNPTVKDKRQIYGEAQGAVADILGAVTSSDFRTNVIVNTHIRWVYTTDSQGNRNLVKGGPSSIGEALMDKIGTYFNNVGLFETSGSGPAVKRTIRFTNTGLIDLKTSAVSMPSTAIPIETGLADFFKAAKSAA
jgi:hypothetical protein